MKNVLAAIKLLLTLECEQSTHLVSDSLDRELSWVERWAVRLHAIGCWSCRRFGKQIRLLRDSLQAKHQVADDAELSPEAIKRIRRAMGEET